MADAKVIPFDDDRPRGSRGAGSRRRGSAAESAPVGEGPGGEVQPLPVRGAAAQDPAEPEEPDESPGARPTTEGGGEEGGEDGGLERRVAAGLSFLRRRLTGDYEVDDFGYDAELTDQVLMSLLRPMYEKYFRVEVKGVENIPAQGGALIVANHSGTLPLDGLMMQVAVHDHHPADRHLRLLAADLVFVLPVVNELARKLGHTLACAEDAERLLAQGELVGVMPEGFKGIGKPFGERYKLQRFGRGGFVSTALRQGVPIVPCSIVGAEEIYPMIGNSKTLARLLGFPYFPLTPTFPWLGPLGAVPLPTKWTIQFGEPIPTDGYAPEAAEDPVLMFNLTDQVREQIQHTLYKLLVQRRSVFF
ncbi:lysophospholipid acyltransferase family protein [Streptomyces tendae]|uniref:lysophospholipid acyltransferase family protein n=1 Tax=Streptomyces tendae TaxID=1932 RepID=UPI0036AACA3F